MFSLRSISFSLVLLAAAIACHAQIDPSNQINWPTGAAGCYYQPGSNACTVPSGSGAGLATCADTSGSSTAQTCTLSPTTTLGANLCFVYTTTTANTGALTLAVNGGSALPVKKWLGSALVSGDVAISQAQIACVNAAQTAINVSTIGNAPTGGGGGSLPNVFDIAAYGGVADGNFLANTGTDNTAAWAAAKAAALAAGGGTVLFHCGQYRFATNGPLLDSSGLGIAGPGNCPRVLGTAGSSHSPVLFTSSATGKVVEVGGASTAARTDGNSVVNLDLGYGLQSTGGAGLLVHDTHGLVVQNVDINDAQTCADITDAPSGTIGGFFRNNCIWNATGITPPGGTVVGWFLHGGSQGFITLRGSWNGAGWAGTCSGTGGATVYGHKIDGSIIDLNWDTPTTSCLQYPLYGDGTVGRDVHITNPQFDRTFIKAYMHIPGANSVDITGGQNSWITIADGTQTAGIELDNTPNARIMGIQCYSNINAPCFYVHGVAGTGQNASNTISNNQCSLSADSTAGQGQCIKTNGLSGALIANNKVDGHSVLTFTLSPIENTGLIYSEISGNSVSNGSGTGAGAFAISLDATSHDNVDANLKNNIVAWGTLQDLGTNNQISTGSTVNVNGSPVSNPNFNGSSPAPDANFVANTFKASSSNVISETPFGTNSVKGALQCDGSTTTCAGGVISSTGGSVTVSTFTCADSSGSGTAQTCTASPTLSSLVANQTCVVYTTTTANTGTGLTINMSALGAKSVAVPGSSGWTTTLTAGIIPVNKPLPMCYDGTNWDVTQTGTMSASGGGAWTNISGIITPTNMTCTSTSCATTGAVSTVTFASVPTGYNKIVIEYAAVSSAVAAGFRCVLNGDNTTGHYGFNGPLTNGGSVSVNSGFNQASAWCGVLNTLGSSGIMEFPFYAATAMPRWIRVSAEGFDSATSGTNDYVIQNASIWTDTTTAINSIQLTTSSGTVASGSKFVIYGVN